MIAKLDVDAVRSSLPVTQRLVYLNTGTAGPLPAKLQAVLESFDGKFYVVRVTACDDVQEIGRGTVGRAVVNIGRFLQKMKSQNK